MYVIFSAAAEVRLLLHDLVKVGLQNAFLHPQLKKKKSAESPFLFCILEVDVANLFAFLRSLRIIII